MTGSFCAYTATCVLSKRPVLYTFVSFILSFFCLFVCLIVNFFSILCFFFASLDGSVITLLEAVGDEHDAVLDKAGKSKPECVVDDEIPELLGLLELPLVHSAEREVQDDEDNKAINTFKKIIIIT